MAPDTDNPINPESKTLFCFISINSDINPMMEKARKKLEFRKSTVDIVHVNKVPSSPNSRLASCSSSAFVNWLHAELMKRRRLAAKKTKVKAIKP
jgi:hypothetical protein